MKTNIIVSTALLGALAMAGTTTVANAKSGMSEMEKCYGINAAYKNDCKSPGHSCAGQDATARDPQAFIAVPAGLCAKIDGGSTSAGK